MCHSLERSSSETFASTGVVMAPVADHGALLGESGSPLRGAFTPFGARSPESGQKHIQNLALDLC